MAAFVGASSDWCVVGPLNVHRSVIQIRQPFARIPNRLQFGQFERRRIGVDDRKLKRITAVETPDFGAPIDGIKEDLDYIIDVITVEFAVLIIVFANKAFRIDPQRM